MSIPNVANATYFIKDWQDTAEKSQQCPAVFGHWTSASKAAPCSELGSTPIATSWTFIRSAAVWFNADFSAFHSSMVTTPLVCHLAISPSINLTALGPNWARSWMIKFTGMALFLVELFGVVDEVSKVSRLDDQRGRRERVRSRFR